MTHEAAIKLMEKMHGEEIDTAKTKGIEYSSENDRLDNFKKIGKQLGINPKIVLLCFLQKHIDGIFHYVMTDEVLSEGINSRLMDSRIYLFLLRGLIEDEKLVDPYNQAKIYQMTDNTTVRIAEKH